MMKNYMLFSVVLFVCTLSGCMRTCLPENTTEVSVELTVRPECMTAVTRSTDETTIRDLNFYLYDSMGVLMLRMSAGTLPCAYRSQYRQKYRQRHRS